MVFPDEREFLLPTPDPVPAPGSEGPGPGPGTAASKFLTLHPMPTWDLGAAVWEGDAEGRGVGVGGAETGRGWRSKKCL